MSTTPLYQPPPPDTSLNQHAYTFSATHGSVGPVIGVLAVITVLGVMAGMFGRVCWGKPVLGYGGHYDLEAWMETKCASCIDGRVEPPRPKRPVVAVDLAGRTQPRSEEASGEIKEEGEDHHDHDPNNEDEDEDEDDDDADADADADEEPQEGGGGEKVSHERN